MDPSLRKAEENEVTCVASLGTIVLAILPAKSLLQFSAKVLLKTAFLIYRRINFFVITVKNNTERTLAVTVKS